MTSKPPARSSLNKPDLPPAVPHDFHDFPALDKIPPLDTVFITGPTASGKTSLALAYALKHNAEIVSADAYQIYREFPILSAAPSAEELALVPHHLVGSIPASRDWDAATHARLAIGHIQDIHARGKRAVISGGSGLYLKFISHGIPPAPPSDPVLRAELENLPLDVLVARLAAADPHALEITPLQNPRYVARNLEIVLTGKKPLASWRQNWIHPPIAPGFVITRPTDELDARIRKRCLQMLDLGLADEIRAIQPLIAANLLSQTASRVLGLHESLQLVAGEITTSQWLDKLTLTTRQYAKRQRTWFRRENWLTPITP